MRRGLRRHYRRQVFIFAVAIAGILLFFAFGLFDQFSLALFTTGDSSQAQEADDAATESFHHLIYIVSVCAMLIAVFGEALRRRR